MNGHAMISFQDIELKTNVRTDLGDVKSLMESIRSVGLQNPLLVQYKHTTGVRPDGKTVHSRYYLLDGYRRYEALRRLREEDRKHWKEVPVTLAKVNDDEAAVLMVAANVARKDFGPMETADGIKMLENLGHKIGDIAKSIGLSVNWCQSLIRMRSSLAASVQDAVQKGVVSANAAKAWLDLPEPQQLAALERYTETKGTEGPRAAKRQADRDGGRPDKPRKKELMETLEYATAAGGVDPYWRGFANGIRQAQGLANLASQAKKAAEDLQQSIPVDEAVRATCDVGRGPTKSRVTTNISKPGPTDKVGVVPQASGFPVPPADQSGT